MQKATLAPTGEAWGESEGHRYQLPGPSSTNAKTADKVKTAAVTRLTWHQDTFKCLWQKQSRLFRVRHKGWNQSVVAVLVETKLTSNIKFPHALAQVRPNIVWGWGVSSLLTCRSLATIWNLKQIRLSLPFALFCRRRVYSWCASHSCRTEIE